MGQSGTEGQLYLGPFHTGEDDKLVEQYKKIADKNNKRDVWVVPGEKDSGAWHEEINTDIIIEKQFSKYRDKVLSESDLRKIGRQQTVKYDVSNYYAIETQYQVNPGSVAWPIEDYYGNDAEFFEVFGLIHSGSAWDMIIFDKGSTTDEFKEKTGADFRPYLYYKKSYIKTTTVTTDEEGNTTTTVTIDPLYLIVEGNGLHDHKVFHYEWKIEVTSSENSTTTREFEVLLGETSIRVPNQWQRLDDWVEETYEILSDHKEEIILARNAVWESGYGYTEASEKLEWLFSGSIDSRYLSESFIPTQIMSSFYKAEELFGIPAWFLAALAMKESSLNPNAINEQSGAIGLFQIYGSTKATKVTQLINEYSHLLPPQAIELYNNTPVKDDAFYNQFLSDPYINTLAGCLVFLDKCKANNINPNKIDWEGDGWQNQILPALVSYGGFSYIEKSNWKKYGVKDEADARDPKKVAQWCYDEYASIIYEYTDKFQIATSMPIDGLILLPVEKGGHITSPFGPSKGRASHHGVDFGFSAGTPIRSVAPGKVVKVTYDSTYGNYVQIDHGTYRTKYAHAIGGSTNYIKVGDYVKSGTIIGKVGSTGRSTGPHLHFEVEIVTAAGYKITDPVNFLLSK